MKLKRMVKLLRKIKTRQERIDRSLSCVVEALGRACLRVKRKQRSAERGASRGKRSEHERKRPLSPSAIESIGESVEGSTRYDDDNVGSSDSDEEAFDGSISYVQCRDDRDDRSLAVWIYKQTSTGQTTRSMCVVVEQAVFIRMDDGSDSPAMVKAVDDKTLRVVWPEQFDDVDDAHGFGDVVPIESVQGEPCGDARMHGPAWSRNACRAIAHPRCWLITGDSEVGCYIPWGWSNFDRADFGSATMPSVLRNLWSSVLQPALAMGVEVRADRDLKRVIESCVLSPLRELRVDALDSNGTMCELCKRVCSKQIYKLSFARREPATVFETRLGRTCAASCALAYECVSLLFKHMDRAPVLGDARFAFCRRRLRPIHDDSWRIVELFSGRILTTRGGGRCNLRDGDTDFTPQEYLKGF
ncbi:hypothetical protein CYMTET_57048 [Cymbomonas tetramitiformis]|uniref:Uncharacterized protein n=1 Tax=Cymbomonas tetramitiformis TaxID=36881 RepID=A0AAE0BAU9_9CHLO|nr:hypothetical protein CYMTET_57048 [Cymbomonas tetramitiformis]